MILQKLCNVKKRLFKKRKKKLNKIIAILFIIFLIFFFCYFIIIYKKDFFIISPNNIPFYLIPDNKGGQEISNQNKKGLHLSYKDNNSYNIIKNEKINFSIQIISDSDYNIVNEKRIQLLNKKDLIFLPEHLLIVIFESTLGKEYFLLYKDFKTRIKANEYCNKYAHFLNNCLIVNVQNLD